MENLSAEAKFAVDAFDLKFKTLAAVVATSVKQFEDGHIEPYVHAAFARSIGDAIAFLHNEILIVLRGLAAADSSAATTADPASSRDAHTF